MLNLRRIFQKEQQPRHFNVYDSSIFDEKNIECVMNNDDTGNLYTNIILSLKTSHTSGIKLHYTNYSYMNSFLVEDVVALIKSSILRICVSLEIAEPQNIDELCFNIYKNM